MTELPKRHSLSNADWLIRLDPDERGELFAEELNRTHRDDARWMSSPNTLRWDPIRIGATWQGQGHRYNGTAWYRTTLPGEAGAWANERTFVEFESVDYFADVWINDRCLGSHEGPATAFGYELTPYLRPDDNVLCVRVDSPITSPAFREETDQLKTLFKGVLERADTNDPSVVSGGITGDVTLIHTGPARLGSLDVTASPVDATDELGTRADSIVTVTACLDGPASLSPVTVRLRLRALTRGETLGERETNLVLTGGPQPLNFQFHLPEAELWWPWDLGNPALHEAELSVEVDGRPSDARRCRFGIRSVDRSAGWATRINGVRVFQRGANYVCDQLREKATDERYRNDIALLIDANLNTVHPFCIVERQCFYDACDEAGLLVYQDFPTWMTVDDSSATVRRALAVQREMITQLRSHPSIIIWNCGSQPSVANAQKLCSALAEQARHIDPSRIANLANAAVAAAPEDQRRAHPRRSFFWDAAHAQRLADDLGWYWDTHHYEGWYTGEVADLREQPGQHLELVTEFGAQGIPDEEALRAMMPGEDLWPPDWEVWASRCAQPELLQRRLPNVEDLQSLIQASQSYQAQVVQQHVEHYRRSRFRPCNGAHVFMFVDYWPAITWSVLDYGRRPKAAYAALRRAMAPTQVLLDVPARLKTQENGPVNVLSPVTIVNDRLVEYVGATVSILLDDLEVTEIGPLHIPGNSTLDVPPVDVTGLTAGTHELVAVLNDGAGRTIAVNRYTMTLFAAGECPS